MAPGTFTIKVRAKVKPDTAAGADKITNQVSVTSPTTDPDAADRTATEKTSVATSADLSITKSDSPDPVNAGDFLVYTLTVTNDGPSDAQNVQVNDTLPAELASGATFCTGAACNPTGGSTWTGSYSIGTMAPGTFTIKVRAKVKADTAAGADKITNQVSVTSPTTDPDAADRTATEKTSVATSADLSITKSDSPDPVNAGDYLVYTLTVTNDGPSDAQNVQVNDTLPAELASGATFCTGAACNPVGGSAWTGSYSIGTMAPGTFTIKARAKVKPETAAGADKITNQVSVTSPTSVPDAADRPAP